MVKMEVMPGVSTGLIVEELQGANIDSIRKREVECGLCKGCFEGAEKGI